MPEGGRVVAVSGNGAFEVIPHYLATGVAKAALENLVRYLAVDLAPFGITVNAVSTHLLDKGSTPPTPPSPACWPPAPQTGVSPGRRTWPT